MDKKFPTAALASVIVGIALLVGIFFWLREPANDPKIEPELVRPSPTGTPEVPANIELEQKQGISETSNIAEKLQPTPPPLNESDPHIVAKMSQSAQWSNLAKMLTEEEIVRKTVRAVYGLSEGRIVREYRPIVSPKGKMQANKIGRQTDEEQELFRISRENYARYTPFISLFSLLNNETAAELYQLYLPLFEQAYGELGTEEGSFHSTLLKAIDVLLAAPEIDSAMLLIQPSVAFKFEDPELEKLPSAHKLMLRMGQENSEVLKLELKKFKAMIAELGRP